MGPNFQNLVQKHLFTLCQGHGTQSLKSGTYSHTIINCLSNVPATNLCIWSHIRVIFEYKIMVMAPLKHLHDYTGLYQSIRTIQYFNITIMHYFIQSKSIWKLSLCTDSPKCNFPIILLLNFIAENHILVL